MSPPRDRVEPVEPRMPHRALACLFSPASGQGSGQMHLFTEGPQFPIINCHWKMFENVATCADSKHNMAKCRATNPPHVAIVGFECACVAARCPRAARIFL